jgi:hypothetical protein
VVDVGIKACLKVESLEGILFFLEKKNFLDDLKKNTSEGHSEV